MCSAGTASASRISTETTTAGHGLRCTNSDQRPQRALSPAAAAAARRSRPGSGRRRRSIQSPDLLSTAGSTVSAPTIVSSTASADAIAAPCRNDSPSSSRPSSAMMTVQAAKKTVRPAVSIALSSAASRSMPRAVLGAIARDDDQRVVDPDGEPDQRRELRGELGRVDECEITGTRPSVVPSASSAVSSGTPAAIAEPKKNSRISAAAMTLMNSLSPAAR